MTQCSNSSIGDGGDPYVGIDRFGQLEEVRWNEISNAANWKEQLREITIHKEMVCDWLKDEARKRPFVPDEF